MKWDLLFKASRFDGAGDVVEPGSAVSFFRTDFHKDYDRLIFSNSFRRLSRKTQVHPLSRNDHVHNRLTHSLEVASVGRTLGLKLGRMITEKFGVSISEADVAYILQTACLAHDIGNPPFGHAGEEVIKNWFCKNRNSEYLDGLTGEQLNDFIRLDGNAQSFRVLVALENNRFDGGMRLTLPTLAAVVKYPLSSTDCGQREKFNFFCSEKEIFDKVFRYLELVSDDGRYLRHPVSYLMEVADDICYGLLDIQDALEIGVLNKYDVLGVFENIKGVSSRIDSILDDKEGFDARQASILVSLSINLLIEQVFSVFENNISKICSVDQPKDLLCLMDSGSQLNRLLSAAKRMAREKIFNDRRKVELELGAYNVIGALLDCLIPAVYELHDRGSEDKMDFRNKRALQLMADNKPLTNYSLYEKYRCVIDYIVGMTDNYALYVANQLNGRSD